MRASTSSQDRKARCGACGSEQLVTSFMRKTDRCQFRARPGEPMDEFYCGCQHDPEEWGYADFI